MQLFHLRFLFKVFMAGSFSFLFCIKAGSQTIPAGFSPEQELRSRQLLGMVDSSFSFTTRPAFGYANKASSIVCCSDKDTVSIYHKPVHFAKGKGVLYALPFNFFQQFNSHHPYGFNDGAMISARGYQALASGGIYSSYGPFQLQLQPEMVFAFNNAYEHSILYGADLNKTYARILPGQSSISVSAGKISLSASTANMWWGPGMRSSLLMSNNAPGFPHVSFQTNKPVKTPIGSFEWQLMGGWLSRGDTSLPFENDHLKRKDPLLIGNTRYLSGLTLSYQPKWVPGLFVGFTRAVQSNAASVGTASNFFERYFPVIALAIQKKDVANEDSLFRDQLASFFLRWVFPKESLEVYFEYGFNDYGLNIRDYVMAPTHSAAYIAGLKKVVPRGENKRIEFGVELTQMSQSPDWMTRNAGNWYQHGQLVQGYTNRNQTMGAGAGWGTNVVSADITWINGCKRLGFLLERIERDPQMHPVKWIDLGLAVMPQWKYNQFLISGVFELVKTRNYLWEIGNNNINVHSRLLVQYYF